MTNKEKELIELIRSNENPEQALITAVLIIGSALEQFESCPKPSAGVLRGHA